MCHIQCRLGYTNKLCAVGVFKEYQHKNSVLILALSLVSKIIVTFRSLVKI